MGGLGLSNSKPEACPGPALNKIDDPSCSSYSLIAGNLVRLVFSEAWPGLARLTKRLGLDLTSLRNVGLGPGVYRPWGSPRYGSFCKSELGLDMSQPWAIRPMNTPTLKLSRPDSRQELSLLVHSYMGNMWEKEVGIDNVFANGPDSSHAQDPSGE